MKSNEIPVSSDKKQQDYSPSQRPATRKSLAWAMVREHKFGIFFFSLSYAAVFLPAEIWAFLTALMLKSTAEGGVLPAQSGAQFLLVLCPLMALSGPGAAGLYRVARNWMRDEPRNPWDVFRSAVKDSWKHGLLLTLLTALLPLTAYFAWVYFSGYAASPLTTAAIWVFLLINLLWQLMLPCLEVMAVTYNLSFGQILWNGLYMTLRHPLKSLKTRLLTAVPALIACLFAFAYPGAAWQIAALLAAFYVFYGFGLRQMLFAAHGNALCEAHLNALLPGARVDIGMRSERTVPDNIS